MDKSKVAVITGANTGLGFNLCERLLSTYKNVRLCLACRNKTKAEHAVNQLKLKYAQTDVDYVILDTSKFETVISAARTLKNRYQHIDYLYLNAGMMKVSGIDWKYFWKGLFSSRVFYMFTTGEGLLLHEDEITQDGFQAVFQTNVLGHYALIKELEDYLGGSRKSTQLIWTSSSNAIKENFNIQDIEHKLGKDPYSSSKYCMDILSVALNEKHNKKGIYSHSVCPGLVMTNLTYGILPAWFWLIVFPFIWLLRLFVPSMTYSTENGTEALLWLTTQKPESVDPQVKLLSSCSCLGNAYVAQSKMAIPVDQADELYEALEVMYKKLKKLST